MGEESSQTGVTRKRGVLDDVTNRCPKKGFPLVPGKFLIANDTIRKRECVKVGVDDSASRKRIIGELENTSKAKCRIDFTPDVCGDMKCLPSSKCLDDGSNNPSPSSMTMKIHETSTLDCNAEPVEANIELNVLHCSDRVEKFMGSSDSADFKGGDPPIHGVGEAELSGSCTTSVSSLPLWLEKARDSLLAEGKDQQGCSKKSTGEMNDINQTNAAAVQKKELRLGKCSASKDNNIAFKNLMENIPQNGKESLSSNGEALSSEPLDGNSKQGNSEMSGLLDSKVGNIEKPENIQSIFKHDTDVEEDLATDKACSCSFCLKAAYVWTDLLYQDSKDRLTEINKSSREARFLARRSYAHQLIGRGVGDDKKAIGLESDLMQRWRTLFLHTENILTCESARLQSNLLKLEELRESCRRDVEMISGMSSSEA